MEYKSAGFVESHGGYGCYGVRIEVSLERDLLPNEKSLIDRKLEEIHDFLIAGTRKLDPKILASAAEDKEKILGLFKEPIYVEQIPNGYDGDPIFPWFIVTTKCGRIKIGWRKRVILINWDDTDIKESADKLFPDEDVTKFDKTIHAWGYEKAEEYLDKLLVQNAVRV